MSTNEVQSTVQQRLIDATAALASEGVTVLELDADDRKAMAGSLLIQLEAHIDGRVTRHPESFQQQLKTIEHGTRRAAAPSLLAHLMAILVEGPQGGRTSGGSSSPESGSKAPLYVPALDLVNEIRSSCRLNVSRITGRPTALRSAAQPLDEAVRAWSSAALTEGAAEAEKALTAFQGWIKDIKSLMDPPVLQQVLAPCGCCGTAGSLTLRVLEGASTIKCRACGTIVPAGELMEAAAWVRGVEVEELQEELAAPPAPAPVKITRERLSLADFMAYVEEHGHLPPSNSANDRERRLAQWARQHSKGATNTLEAAERRMAFQEIQAQYPSKRDANRLAQATEMSEAA